LASKADLPEPGGPIQLDLAFVDHALDDSLLCNVVAEVLVKIELRPGCGLLRELAGAVVEYVLIVGISAGRGLFCVGLVPLLSTAVD
jgi:hypothetical protein